MTAVRRNVNEIPRFPFETLGLHHPDQQQELQGVGGGVLRGRRHRRRHPGSPVTSFDHHLHQRGELPTEGQTTGRTDRHEGGGRNLRQGVRFRPLLRGPFHTAVDHFASFEALNQHLRAWCERERVRNVEAWALEETALRELPAHPFRAASSRPVSASKLALVRIDYNRYSVRVRHAGRLLRAEVFVDRVEIYAGEQLTATHARNYERGGTFMRLEHYYPPSSKNPERRRAARPSIRPTPSSCGCGTCCCCLLYTSDAADE